MLAISKGSQDNVPDSCFYAHGPKYYVSINYLQMEVFNSKCDLQLQHQFCQ